MLFFRLLNEFLNWCLPTSSSNWCWQCLCFLVQSLYLRDPLLDLFLQLLSVSQGAAEVSGHGGCGGTVGIVSYRVQLMRGGYWDSLYAVGLPAGRQGMVRQDGEWPRVLTQCQTPRDWGGQLGDKSLPPGPLRSSAICVSEIL